MTKESNLTLNFLTCAEHRVI